MLSCCDLPGHYITVPYFCRFDRSITTLGLNRAFFSLKMNGLLVLLLSSWISYAASKVDVIEDRGPNPYHNLGATFSLTCEVTGNDTFGAWRNPAGEVQNSTELGGKHTVIISNLQLKDAGVWTCESTDGVNDTIIINVNVVILSPRNLKQNLLNGSSGIIQVNIGGRPLPSFEWKKDSKNLDVTGRFMIADNGSLHISTVMMTDAGIYEVLAKQLPLKETISNINVSVWDVPIFTSTSIKENRTLGGNITFKCAATGVPTPDIGWKKGLDKLTSDARRVITKDGLTIVAIQKGDAGDYTCIAQNSAAIKEQVFSLTSVLVPPNIPEILDKIAEKGKTLNVYCNATGDPKPDVNWMKDGSVLLDGQQIKYPGGSLLQIHDIQTGQGGTYDCSAKNGAVDPMGNEIISSQSMNIFVVYPPEIDSFNSKPVTTGLDKKVELKCSASGIPAPNVSLLFDEKPLKGSFSNGSTQTNLTFVISSTKPDDFGTYTCVASNELNTIKKTVTLTLPLDKPEIYDVNASCSSVKFSWHRDTRGFIKVKGFIVSIKKTDAGSLPTTKFSSANVSDDVFFDLEEDTNYQLSVEQKTKVSTVGRSSTHNFNTTKCLEEINDVQVTGHKVTIYWPESSKNVELYVIKYRVTGTENWEEMNVTKRVMASITGLAYGKKYDFQVFAVVEGNVVAHTDIKTIETFSGPVPTTKSAEQASTTQASTENTKQASTTQASTENTKPPPRKVARKKGLSGGAIAAIVIVIILLVLIAVDIFCCFFNQCGVVHMCAAACAGKSREKYNVDGGNPEEGTKLKEIEEGDEQHHA